MAANKRLVAEIDAQESLIRKCIAVEYWKKCTALVRIRLLSSYTFANHPSPITLRRHSQQPLFCSQPLTSHPAATTLHSFSFPISLSPSLLQRKYRSINYHGESNFSALLTPITFLISYFNSAFNPLLYAFLSRNFRKGMREIIFCSFKKKNSKEQQRIPLHVSKSVFWQIFIERCRLLALKMNTHS